MLEIAALVTGVVLTMLIGVVVFVRNNQSVTSRLFLLLTLALVGWSLTTYLSLHTESGAQTLFWIRFVMFFVILQNTSFFLLVKLFPLDDFDILKHKGYLVAIVYSILTALVAVSPFLFVDFKDGAPVPGPGMALFLPHALFFAGGGILSLFMRYRHAEGVKRAQLQAFLSGTVLMFTLLPLGNFVIPVLLKFSQFVVFSPLYPIVFAGLIAYGIIAKRMFDIRLTITRTLTYLMLLLALVVLYAIVVFGSVELLFGGNQVDSTLQSGLYMVAAIFLAFTFVPLKSFFSKLTRRIFYRDSYETKQVLDKLTSILVRAGSVERLSQSSLTILKDALKAEGIAAYILEAPGYSVITKGTIKDVKTLLPRLTKKSISILEAQDEELTQAMRALNVSIIAKLETSGQQIGYLVFAYKANGNAYSRQDIDLIRIAADELAVAIQNALRFEEITRFNETLQGEVNEATKKLRESNKKLRALDEAKDEFISMASHQLRTPLTSVKGYVSMVLEGDAGKLTADQRKLLEEAYASSQRMVYMIADFLNVSRLKTGKFLLEPSTVNLADIVREEIEQLRPAAKGRSLNLHAQLPEPFPLLRLDETKIRQVIMNFIDNAIFYSRPGGDIAVSLSTTDDKLTFTVKDTGIGVPHHEKSQIFSKFFRATNAMHVRPDGTGIGLFMAKKVITAHGGEMIFESQEGQGSTFGFTLPFAALKSPGRSPQQSAK